MVKIFDIKTINGDLIFENGDLAIFESSKESAHALLDSSLAQYRLSPEIDVNLFSYENSNETATTELSLKIRENFEKDGYNVNDLSTIFDPIKGKFKIISKFERLF